MAFQIEIDLQDQTPVDEIVAGNANPMHPPDALQARMARLTLAEPRRFGGVGLVDELACHGLLEPVRTVQPLKTFKRIAPALDDRTLRG